MTTPTKPITFESTAPTLTQLTEAGYIPRESYNQLLSDARRVVILVGIVTSGAKLTDAAYSQAAELFKLCSKVLDYSVENNSAVVISMRPERFHALEARAEKAEARVVELEAELTHALATVADQAGRIAGPLRPGSTNPDGGREVPSSASKLADTDPFWAVEQVRNALRNLRDYSPADLTLSCAIGDLRDAVTYLLRKDTDAVEARRERNELEKRDG